MAVAAVAMVIKCQFGNQSMILASVEFGARISPVMDGHDNSRISNS